ADPKAMLAAAAAVSPGDSDAVVLLDELRYTFDAQGRATHSERIVFCVVDGSAVDDWSTVETMWAPWYHERPHIEARVIAKDGSVHSLDQKAITEAPAEDAAEMFSDNRVLRAPLPAVAAGSIVEQLITWKETNPLFDSGTTGSFRFGRWVPVQTARMVVDAPSSLNIRLVNKTAPKLEPSKSEKDGRQTILFESGR